MSLNTAMVEKYRNNFLQEVAGNVEEGDWVKMCMQCGVCAGSCPLGDAWEHTPQKLFMMIRANKRDEVLTSESMWMCTSCYNCVVRCPRELPITHIMHHIAPPVELAYLLVNPCLTLQASHISNNVTYLFWRHSFNRWHISKLPMMLLRTTTHCQVE